ncbi:MAG TPA: hypothetical protein DCX25_02210 [Candidatus Pacebacteria bacterium]|nr:MAG: hypothetical protein UX00_C0007G0122 [Microgenomates group bacterium GW2011_GWB1_45_17]KKU23350.1 MAG: hypothetical protein UX35_C0006G0026 [Microgenomates group bacterium GW2011_GWA1_46_15]KKU24521.1 MAG: hypothetical protein UX36_C0001G0138 [Microgenomates group bacterium GW2011_GWC1_46_15]HAV15118.1 hypothetical protein [Candidatus Paceibacterota bacterium]HCR11055.1 hypothetical protein [Candidatus Paceibacterota bacterium]
MFEKDSIEYKRVVSPGHIRLSAELHGKIVGSVIIFILEKIALLEKFHVDSEVRKNGVGTHMLEEVEALCVEQGAFQLLRIGMFCDADSIFEYIAIVQFLRKRKYKYRGIWLSKKLR